MMHTNYQPCKCAALLNGRCINTLLRLLSTSAGAISEAYCTQKCFLILRGRVSHRASWDYSFNNFPAETRLENGAIHGTVSEYLRSPEIRSNRGESQLVSLNHPPNYSNTFSRPVSRQCHVLVGPSERLCAQWHGNSRSWAWGPCYCDLST
jgi:hypothetical protein